MWLQGLIRSVGETQRLNVLNEARIVLSIERVVWEIPAGMCNKQDQNDSTL